MLAPLWNSAHFEILLKAPSVARRAQLGSPPSLRSVKRTRSSLFLWTMAVVSNNSTLELLTSFKSLPSMISRVCCRIFELRFHIDFDNFLCSWNLCQWHAVQHVLVRPRQSLIQPCSKHTIFVAKCLFFGIFAFNQE